MQNIATIYENQSSDKYFGPARVIGFELEKKNVKVAITQNRIRKEVTARLAIALSQKFSADDEFLVAEDNNGNFYVIGIINVQQLQPDPSPQIILSDGTMASVKDSESGQRLCVYSDRNELLFEYDPDAKNARIFLNSDNVTFDVPRGNLELNAGGNIHLKGQRVALAGNTEVGIAVGQLYENLKSRLSLKPGIADINSQEIKVSAKRANLFLDEARNNIKTMVSKIGSAKMIINRLETTATSIIEKTINAYRTTEDLNQVKAGRMRMLIQKTFHLKGKTAVIKAEDDVKVKGEKIHLG